MPGVRFETAHGGAVERIILSRPRANLLDAAAVGAIRERLYTLEGSRALKLLVFDSDGADFSFGASVPEHLPGAVEQMLPAFHRMFEELETLGVPTAAVLRGRCLGGAAELACFTGTVFCTPDARIGVPEITLGVFPPIAALTWRWRVGGSRATELVLTGRTVRGEEATALGLADTCADDPGAALEAWYQEHLAPRSAAALRFAWRAARTPLRLALRQELPAMEQLYLEELMSHPDSVEGLTAFVERRAPRWSEA